MNQSVEKKGRKRLTGNQLEKLVQFMEGHRSFARAGLMGPSGCIKQAQMWDELTLMLNACGDGPSKNATLWQKTWTSLKSNVKAKASKVAVYAKGTGGGSPLKPWTELEEGVLAVSGPQSVTGDESLPEAGCSKPQQACSNKKAAIHQAVVPAPENQQPEDHQTKDLQPENHAVLHLDDLQHPLLPGQHIFQFTEANAIIQTILPAKADTARTPPPKRKADDASTDIKAGYIKGQERRCDIDEKRLKLDEDALKLEREIFELEREKFTLEKEKFEYQKVFFEKMCTLVVDNTTRMTNALINLLNK